MGLPQPSNHLGTSGCKQSQFRSQNQLPRAQSLMGESQHHRFSTWRWSQLLQALEDDIQHVNELNCHIHRLRSLSLQPRVALLLPCDPTFLWLQLTGKWKADLKCNKSTGWPMTYSMRWHKKRGWDNCISSFRDLNRNTERMRYLASRSRHSGIMILRQPGQL